MPLRIALTDATDTEAEISDSTAIQAQLVIAEDVARTTDKGDLVALFIELLNETIDCSRLHVARDKRAYQ